MFLYDILVDEVFELSFTIIVCGKVNNIREVDSTHRCSISEMPAGLCWAVA